MKSIMWCLVITFLSVMSCKKDDVSSEDRAGDISGMGDAGGDLDTEVYDFHEDIMVGDFCGAGDKYQASFIKKGSGDQVMVFFKVYNTNLSECRTLWLRAGSLFEVDLWDYQNGILLAPVEVSIEPNSIKYIQLCLYCLNQGKRVSDEKAIYEFKGVTNSELMLRLIKLLEFKKINFEHYDMRPEVKFNYPQIKDSLQKIVWEITNGTGMGQDSWVFINGLPSVSANTLPNDIYYLDKKMPDCWSDLKP